MSRVARRSTPSWRVQDGRLVRPEPLLLAGFVVAMLLVEVWGNARLAEVSMDLDRGRTSLQQARARLEFVRADLERASTRAELRPLASRLGLAPPEAHQVVMLPPEYLAAEDGRREAENHAPLLAWAERAARVFVSEARARSRSGS